MLNMNRIARNKLYLWLILLIVCIVIAYYYQKSKAVEDYQEMLEIAAKNCNLETIKSLVKKSRDASKAALYYSAEKGYLGVVKFLLDERVDGNLDVSGALFNAVEGGQLEVVKLLLKRGANPHVRGWKGKTPKAMAIKRSFYSSKPYREIIDLLAEAEKNYKTEE